LVHLPILCCLTLLTIISDDCLLKNLIRVWFLIMAWHFWVQITENTRLYLSEGKLKTLICHLNFGTFCTRAIIYLHILIGLHATISSNWMSDCFANSSMLDMYFWSYFRNLYGLSKLVFILVVIEFYLVH